MDAKKKVEDLMVDVLTQMRDRQHIHRAMKGKHWQGARTHKTTPKEQGAAPNPSAKIEGQESWAEFGVNLPQSLPASLQVDVYDGPLGSGYTVTADVVIEGKTWRRVANVGPESYRTMDWHIVEVG